MCHGRERVVSRNVRHSLKHRAIVESAFQNSLYFEGDKWWEDMPTLLFPILWNGDRSTPSRDSCAGERRTPACARPRGAHGDTVRSSDRSSYGTAITFRSAGAASFRTPDVAATVEINIDILKSLNSTNVLKLKFPKE